MPNSEKFNEMDKGFDIHQAIAEANRCLLCYDPPCSKGCPGGTDPGTFIRKLRLRNITGAIRTIKQNNILGGVCGVLCPTAQFCEKECSATQLDRPIQIGRLQRFLAEYSWKTNFKVLERVEKRSGKIAIIGSGPAGLSCAAELSKAGCHVTIFEARAETGGALRYGVPSYRLSPDFLEKELAPLKELGVEFKCNSPIQGEGAAENLLKQGYNAVFLAPGLWKPIKLNNQDVSGVFSAIDFLAAIREEKYDRFAPLVENKSVAIIGGGAVASDCAITAKMLGARAVEMFVLETLDEMPIIKDELLHLLSNKIEVSNRVRVTNIVSGPDSTKRLEVVKIKLEGSETFRLDALADIPGTEHCRSGFELVIVAIGLEPVEESTRWYPSVKLTDKNLVEINSETCETSVKGIFAGGDIVNGPSYVIQAVKDGKVAADSILKYLDTLEVGE